MIGSRLFFQRVATVICATWCLVGRESPGAVSLMPADSRPLQFAQEEIERAAKDSGRKTPDVCLAISPAADGCAQAYRIERAADGTIRVSGDDARGAMYGGLDVAEAIRLATLDRVPVGQRKPFIQERGIKFNIPLDLRTPSYSDNSDAAQANIPEMWSIDFWRTMLDETARHRYTALTLWNLHPFPSIVQVPKFPEVALDDVLRAKPGSFDERFSHSGRDMFRPELLDGAEVVKRLIIRDKIAFWREVIERDPMPGSGGLGIKAWRRAKLDGRAMTGATPLELADQLAAQARVVRESLPALRRQARSHTELTATLDDLEMFAQLGDYYAAKVRAACDLALFDATADEGLRRSAVQHLETALIQWQAYAETYAARYQQRVLYNRVGWVDRTALIENVRADIELACQWKPGSQPGDRPKNPANPRAD